MFISISRRVATFVTILFLCCYNSHLFAHAKQENYIWINVDEDGINGRFELNSNDLENKLDVDIDSSGDTRLSGAIATAPEVQKYLKDNFEMRDANGPIDYKFTTVSIFEENDKFVQYNYETSKIPSDNLLKIKNTIWLTEPYVSADKAHRSLVVVEYNEIVNQEFGTGNVALVFSPRKTEQEIDLSNPGTILEWKDFLWQGILHIGIGLDHILFITVLLLGVVIVQTSKLREPVPDFKTAFINTVKIVTIFTVAHSITLSLAALDLIDLPTHFIETVIAASIAAVALNNIFPRFYAHSWVLIFVFGLFHGLGFATVMGDLQFRNGLIERILLMFNIGVEIGQLIIVAIVLPILFMLRKKSFYKPVIVNSLSVIAIIVSAYWVLERAGILVI